MKLFQVDTLATARQKLLAAMEEMGKKALPQENIPFSKAAGRILAKDFRAPEPLPAFARATVDGYAVRAVDTQGAGESLPVFLTIVDEVHIGEAAATAIGPGECAYVPTGGMLPPGADAMVMIEHSELFDATHVALYQAVAYGRDVVFPGEDVRQGDLVLPAGSRLEFGALGALAALGLTTVPVWQPLRLSIISTGDELVPAECKPNCGQIRDINTYALRALAERAGFFVVRTRVLQDEEPLLREALQEAMHDSDIIAVSGGSSQGKKDMTGRLMDEVASPGLFTHGLALKPGKPTILAKDIASGTLLVGLPGHPAAALMVFHLLLVWLWETLCGVAPQLPLTAELETNLPAAPGRLTCQPVMLIEKDGKLLARPVLGKSALITTVARADGYLIIEGEREGLPQGALVQVYRW